MDVFQIDMGWEARWGNWISNNYFPSGMKQIADKIKACGLRPGIWTCPFLVEPRSKLRFEHPEWILNKKDGSPYYFKMRGHAKNMRMTTGHHGPKAREMVKPLPAS